MLMFATAAGAWEPGDTVPELFEKLFFNLVLNGFG